MFEWKNKTDEQIVKFVQEQFSRAQKKRLIYENLWDVVIKIFRPRLHSILDINKKGQQYGATVFDQHPANALSKFVAGLIGYMVSRSTPWLQFVTSDSRLMNLDKVKSYCQDAAEQVIFAAGRSNFYSSLVPAALDAHSIGTSVSIPNSDEVKDRVVFDVVHPRDSFIITNRFGEVIIYMRSLKLMRLTALEYFGKDKLPENWFRENDLKDPFSEDEYIWSIWPNNDRDIESLLPIDREFIVFCVMKSSGSAKKTKLVLKSGRSTFPPCWRAMKESGADYGTSLAADCLTSSLVSNKLDEKGLAAVHQAVEPSLIASKSLRASLTQFGTNPGSRHYVDDISKEYAKSLFERFQWPISDAQLQRIHGQIDDRFFIRFFEMLSMGDMKARTAYEISQMMSEKAVLMASIVDTFEQEMIEPSIEALIFHETEAGRMPDPPEEIIMTGGRIDVRYIGPLAQLQRTLLRSKGIVDGMAVISQMAAISEDVVWKFNWLEAAEEAATAQGWPQKFVRSDDEVEETRQQVAQARAAQQQVEMAEKIGKSAASLGKKTDANSPLAALMGAGKA